MKVCFVSHSSDKMGAERTLLELIDALNLHSVECYAILPSKGILLEALKRRCRGWSVIPFDWWMGPSGGNAKVRPTIYHHLDRSVRIAEQIRVWECALVYTNTITICVGALAARLLGLTHVWHIQEYGPEHHGITFDLGEDFSLWLLDQFSSACIANSHAVGQKYQPLLGPGKLRVIYGAVTVSPKSLVEEPFNPLSNDADTIRCVMVGAIQEGKRQDEAIQAIAELARAGKRVELTIVGPSSDLRYRGYLRALIAEHRLKEAVKFTGYVENPLSIVQSADVALICSRYEAFGRVTVEAMRAGKPVIGARSGGTPELIQDGFNGLLYTPGDHRELAEKISYLHKNAQLARTMGQNGLQWANEHFSEKRFGDEVFRLLNELLSQTQALNVADRYLIELQRKRLWQLQPKQRKSWEYSRIGRAWRTLTQEGPQNLVRKGWQKLIHRD